MFRGRRLVCAGALVGLMINGGVSAVTDIEANAEVAPDSALVDFNGDGRGDVVVGIPLEDVGKVTNAGAVQVLYGAAEGYSTGPLLTQNTPGVSGTAEAGDRFGYSVEPARVNDDQFVDLVLGVPYEDVGRAVNAGGIHVLYGSAGGLTGAGSVFLTQNSRGMPGKAERGDRFGSSIVAADFGKGGLLDVAIGVPDEDLGRDAQAGEVQVVYDLATSTRVFDGETFTQDTPGVDGSTERGDRFGWALAAADFGKTATADLAVGVPLEDLAGSDIDAGIVQILYSSDAGLSGKESGTFSQDSLNFRSASERGDRFGSALAAADFGVGILREPGEPSSTSYADLAVGVPGEDVNRGGTAREDSGLVQVIYGSSDGLTDRLQPEIMDQSRGAGAPETGDQFGATLAAADFGEHADNNEGYADLAVGVPFEDLINPDSPDDPVPDAGGVNVFYGSRQGIGGFSEVFLSQGIEGVVGALESDWFGASLAAGQLGGSDFADLIVGAPSEDLNGKEIPDGGIVHIFYGSTSGEFDEKANDFSTQRLTEGDGDPAEPGDQFGYSVGALEQR